MRVLVIAAATYADPHTRKVFDRLAEKGVEIVLAMPRRVKHPFRPTEVPDTPWPTPGVRLVKLDTWYSHENGTHIIMKGIPGLIREVRPDIIHCVLEPWSLTCLEVLACLSTMRRRPRFGLHPGETKPEQGGFLARHVRQALYRRVVSRCDYFVGWSSLTVKAASQLGLNGQPNCVAPAVGPDLDLFRPPTRAEKLSHRTNLGIKETDVFLLGYVGRLVEEKGIPDLISVVEGIVPAAGHLQLLLVGSGPLEAQLRTKRFPWLHMLHRTDRVGVARILQALDALVLPSRSTPSWEEQFGLILTEAMASGVPIIASTSGAIPEVMGNVGWVFPQGDTSALRERILHAARRPPEIVGMATMGPRRARSLFSDHVIARELFGVWKEAMCPRPAPVAG